MTGSKFSKWRRLIQTPSVMFSAFTSPAEVSHEKRSDHWSLFTPRCLILAKRIISYVLLYLIFKISIIMIGNICLEIINLYVSISFTEACLAMLHSTRRWRPVLLMAVFVPCSLCHISHCVTICCSKASLSLQHSSSAALAVQHQTCQRQMVGVALRWFHKCQGI